MGTYSDFRIGNFHLESGGNFSTTTHQSIYLPTDSVTLNREYEPKQVEGFRATLRSILPRLELLGSTLPAIEHRFDNPYVTYDEPHDIPFADVLKLVRNVDLASLVEDDSTDDHAGLLPAEYQKRLEDPVNGRYGQSPSWDLSTLLDRLDPYDTLRVLAERPENLDLVVQWDFMDVVESGYFERKDFSIGADGQGFLLVTEGTSDTKVIQHAFAILRPEIADFFQFVDMEDNYPFGGHGNLMNFMTGLRSIGKADGVLAIRRRQRATHRSSMISAGHPTRKRIMPLPRWSLLWRVKPPSPNSLLRPDLVDGHSGQPSGRSIPASSGYWTRATSVP